MVTLEAARTAQPRAIQILLRKYPEVSGVGLTRRGRDWALKVNLTREPRRPLPTQVDGVPLVQEVVGEAVAQ